ncbi:sphingosine-1-phosphate lyase isoform X2 [Copidosoma floridanum]|nr:sphingosine-1-phosphate lyase isoform X2 [Copidosoma floridanum]
MRIARLVPAVRRKIEHETRRLDEGFENQMKKMTEGMPHVTSLPAEGMAHEDILALIERCVHSSDYNWKTGRVSGCVYKSSDPKQDDVMAEVFRLTSATNPLHADVFPGVCKLEAEVVRIACKLFNGDDDCCGTMTSGGTESILMAVKACRDYAREAKGIRRPEIVMPVTAHAAFDKAAQYFKIRVRTVPVHPETYTVDLNAMRRAIGRNTIMLVGSAPNFPYGTMDDIGSISRLGLLHKVPVHVDACLGGFLVCFMRKAGFQLPDFDFKLPGVTSISADTHKYGYAPKGSSVVLYRSKELRHHQFVISPDWPGGIYGSPTVNGSRAGSSIATCWATLMSYGERGYVEATRKVIDTTRFIEKELREIEGIYVLGKPATSVVAFSSRHFHIYTLSQQLNKRGWNLNSLQFPNAVHMCVTLAHTQPGIADTFVKDVREEVLTLLEIPPEPIHGMYAVYGMSQGVADRSVVEDITKCFLDSLYYTPRDKQPEEKQSTETASVASAAADGL